MQLDGIVSHELLFFPKLSKLFRKAVRENMVLESHLHMNMY